MSDRSTKEFCSECGLELPEGETTAGCPNCLLRLALGDAPAEAPAAPQLRLPPGLKSRFFGDYELLNEISRGGMGLVYRARQLSLNRMVAVKMIHGAHLASPEARLRFRVEIETVAQLDHPHIVSLYEAGEHDGTHFFSMRLVEGTNLGEYVKAASRDASPRLKLRQGVPLLLEICRAVHYAHQRGILHRDLKPSNILIDREGEPHVVDFGLAKTLARESSFTLHESILGSPNYMPPEQAAGRAAELTTTADVYGIGAIMYEMLTGRPPFQASTPLDTIRKVVDEEPTPPRKLNASIDSDLETICLRCLQKNPANRYSSAEELAGDLERWLDGKPILARPVGRLEHVRRWCYREPALAAAVAVSLGLVITLAVVASVAALRIGRAERQARASLRDSLLDQAHLLRLRGGLGQRSEGLRLIGRALALGPSAEFRDRARDEVLALLVRSDLKVIDDPSLRGSSDPALSIIDAAHTLHATVMASNTVVLRRLDDGVEVSRFSCGDVPIQKLEQFSHDSRFLAMRRLDGVSIWNARNGERVFATNGPNRVYFFASKDPLLVLEEWGCQAAFLELPSFREVRRLQGTPNAPDERQPGWSAISLSPNGNQLAVSHADVIEVIDVLSNQIHHRLTNSAPITALAWNPDNRRLAAGLANGRIMVWDLLSGRWRINMPPVTGSARSLAFNPAGNLLAIGSTDRVLRVLDLTAVRYGFEKEVSCHTQNPSFSPDGQRLGVLFRANQPGWLQIARPSEFYEFNVASTSVQLEGCTFSPDGRILAAGTLTNIVLCDATTGARLTSLPRWRITAFCFDPLEQAAYAAFTVGMLRWDLKWSDASESASNTSAPQLRFVNEQKIFPERGWRAFTFSPDGRALVAANIRSNAAFVFDRTFTNELAQLGPHVGADFVTISRDRKWLATGSSADRQIKVWDVQSAEESLALAVGQTPRGAFSHDGKWLATFGDNFELRATGSWKPAQLPFGDRPSVLGAAAFSPDSRLLAVVRDLSRIQLFDLKTLRSLGVLQPPGSGEINAITFSPDGTKLAAVGSAARLRIWNIPRLRHRLAELDLDWDIPPSAAN